MRERILATLGSLANRRIGVVILLGFSSGLPLALTGGTLQAWMAVEGVDMVTIGIFTMVGLPYVFKFLWAPLLDRFVLPFLGRRRGWIVVFQLALIIIILVLGQLSPERIPWIVFGVALAIAFSSASQDIVVDAYRTDVLEEREWGPGAGVFVTGYRIAMLISGAIALILAESIGWRLTYMLMAGLMTIGVLAALWGPEPDERVVPPRTLQEAVWRPLKEFFLRWSSQPEGQRTAQGILGKAVWKMLKEFFTRTRVAWAFLALIVLYKLGDAFAGSLTTAFLLKGPGFSLSEVGVINKGFGLAATIIGALFGGLVITRLGLYRSLLFFGILQAVSNLSFMVLAYVGKVYPVMVFAIGFENLCGGMGTAAFLAFLMALCDHRFTATQFALLSSLAALGRVFVGPPSGFLADSVGWVVFFFITFLAALPGLILLWAMKDTVRSLEHETDNEMKSSA